MTYIDNGAIRSIGTDIRRGLEILASAEKAKADAIVEIAKELKRTNDLKGSTAYHEDQ